MAVTTLYFGASSAGAADGTTWANRAAFVSGGAINTLISAFDFTSNSLIARIGPGTYALTTAIATFTGTTGPSQTFPCFLEAALSDGTRWQPPDPDWCSAQPEWDADDATYPMPVITTSSNISTISSPHVVAYGLKMTASNRNGAIINTSRSYYWCQVINSTSNTSAGACIGATVLCENNFYSCTGTSYDTVASSNSGVGPAKNCRIEGNPSATTGNRRGWSTANNAAYPLERCTIIGNVGGGVVHTGTGSGSKVAVSNCVIADNEGDAVSGAGTATTLGIVSRCMITGPHTNGVNITGTGDCAVHDCRIRDYTSAAITGTLDWSDPPLNGNITTAGTDADEYVDAASGDYRIKNTSTYWGKGYGAGDQPAGGGGGPLIGGRLVR